MTRGKTSAAISPAIAVSRLRINQSKNIVFRKYTLWHFTLSGEAIADGGTLSTLRFFTPRVQKPRPSTLPFTFPCPPNLLHQSSDHLFISLLLFPTLHHAKQQRPLRT